MDPREDARRTSAPSAGPPPLKADMDIGVSDLPPWELAGASERPPTLPARQPPPWPVAPRAQPPAGATRDEVPWDRPAPFAPDAELDADPYDAHAPLAEDVAFERDRLVVERELTFADAFATLSAPRPPVRPRLTKSFTADAGPTELAPAAPTEPTDLLWPPELEGQLAQSADPLVWPPVPTEFRPRDESRTAADAAPSPLDWPPIPADRFGATVSAPATSDLVTADEPATAEEPSPADQPNDQPPSLWEPAAAQAAPPAAMPPMPPTTADEDDLWVLPSFERDDRLTASPIASPAPIVDTHSADDNPSDTVFARYAAAAEHSDDLWFVTDEPAALATEDETPAGGPSALQTAVATLLVAMIVIGLVIVFLLLFTSVFR
jgi:hypothetical protein